MTSGTGSPKNAFRVAFVLSLFIPCILFPWNVSAADHDTLEVLQLFIRHGNRTPAYSTESLVPFYKQVYGSFAFGEITTEGRQQMLDTGAYLRQRYSGFLPDEYSYETAYVKCSENSRVRESALVAMAGLFPPKGRQVWGSSGLGANWTPIPCDYVPGDQDSMMDPVIPDCPRFTQLGNDYSQSPEFLSWVNEQTANGTLNTYIQKNLGLQQPITTDDYGTLFDNFIAMTFMGITLPPWVERVFPTPITDISTKGFKQNWSTSESIQFTIGDFLIEMLGTAATVENKSMAPGNRKLFAYFGHDFSIMTLLVALGLERNPVIPSFGAALMMELHRIPETAEIGYRILYRNATWLEPILYTIPGCQEICPLKYVRNYVKEYIPTEPYAKRCRQKK